jgi:transposase-like protein
MVKNKMADEIAALREKTWTPEDARRVLAACAATGGTQAEFAREHRLRQERLSFWRSRLRNIEETAAAANGAMVRFVPAVVKEAAVAGGGATTVIRVSAGVAVEIADASPEWVAGLVRCLCEAAS